MKARGVTARDEGPEQQARVVPFSRDRECPLGDLQATRCTDHGGDQRQVGDGSGVGVGVTSAGRASVGEDCAEPGQTFQDAAPRAATTAEVTTRAATPVRRCRRLAAPRERGPQVVDVGLCLLDVLPSACRAVGCRAGPPGPCSGRGGGSRTSSASPDSPSFSSAYCRTVSSSRYRVRPPAFSATTSDLSTSRVSWSRTWWRCNVLVAGDGLRGVEVESAHEHRQPAEQDALGFGQQRVRPVDRGAQGLLAPHRGARAAGQQAEAVVQAVEDLGQRQRAHPRGRELDGERHAVEPLADLRHGRGVVVGDGEVGPEPAGRGR